MNNLLNHLLKCSPYICLLAVAIGGFNLTALSYYTGDKTLAAATAVVFILFVGIMGKRIVEKEHER